jgi:hypothetical protein
MYVKFASEKVFFMLNAAFALAILDLIPQDKICVLKGLTAINN